MGDDETEAVYRSNVRYSRRLNLANSTSTTLVPVPSSETKDYTIQLPKTNLLTDLLYVPKTIGELNVDEVVVEVRCASLNFKDVLNVMKPSEEFKENNTIGLDFSGVITSVGSKVTGLSIGTPVFGMTCTQNAISGYVTVCAHQLVVIPPAFTFAEAATLPVAFLTAWYCLVNVAQASQGQSILIHAASGGVGIVAIQIAKFLGLNIIATAGSPRKRRVLTRQLGVHHVFNSRTVEYGQKIKEVTNGQGVDIVLNCLTGPGFKEASLGICKNGGSFVEISKLDIWQEGEVEKRKPGVKYTIVDLTIVEPIVITNMIKDLSRLLAAGSLKPLPFTRFTASRIVSALQFLQKAKHIGKVIVEMPKFDVERKTFRDMLFNDRSTYLITGGKGAIGLAIAEWMISLGAKYIVLLGRGPPKENVLDIIHKLGEQDGAKISCIEANVADFEEMRKVIQDIEADFNLPPLRGIHHCAGVLSDRMIVAQNWKNFEHVLDPKVNGAYNLHKLTLQTTLEFFVVHSSLSCTIGNFGQSNYAAGNLYMEALVEKRVSFGLPGMSISWGLWNTGLAQDMEIEILTAFTVAQGIAALERFFLENRVSGGAALIKVPRLCLLSPVYENTFLENIPLDSEKNGGGVVDDEGSESLLDTYGKAEGAEEKRAVLRVYVKNELCKTLGVTPQEMAEDVNFARMGLDSLLSIEFYNKLQSAMGEIDLGYIDMEEYGTVEQISMIIQTVLDKTNNV